MTLQYIYVKPYETIYYMNYRYLLRDLGRAQVSQLGGREKARIWFIQNWRGWINQYWRAWASKEGQQKDRQTWTIDLTLQFWCSTSGLSQNHCLSTSFLFSGQNVARTFLLSLWVTHFLFKPIHLNLSGTIWNIDAVISRGAALREIPKVFKPQ